MGNNQKFCAPFHTRVGRGPPIIWTPCFSILFFQADNTGPVCVTLKPFMVEGHAVSHFKALVIFYQEPEDQDCCSFFSICNTRLKMGVFTVF